MKKLVVLSLYVGLMIVDGCGCGDPDLIIYDYHSVELRYPNDLIIDEEGEALLGLLVSDIEELEVYKAAINVIPKSLASVCLRDEYQPMYSVSVRVICRQDFSGEYLAGSDVSSLIGVEQWIDGPDPVRYFVPLDSINEVSNWSNSPTTLKIPKPELADRMSFEIVIAKENGDTIRVMTSEFWWTN